MGKGARHDGVHASDRQRSRRELFFGCHKGVTTLSSDLDVVHVIAGLHPMSGGPSRTVVQLSDALASTESVTVTLLSQSLVGEPTIGSRHPDVDRRLVESSSRLSLKLGVPVRRALRRCITECKPSLIHNHGLWLPVNHWAARAARRYNIPLLIHPRGMLETWALDHRGLKKRLALRLYQQRDLETAALLFATAEQEAENIRRLGLRQPIAVIPNGVKLAMPLSKMSRRDGMSDGIRNALFLGRIHPIKGLLNLIDAWDRVRPADWRLRLAGPNEGGHLAEVMQRVRVLSLETSVEYVGEVEGDTKAALFATTDLFVLPSFSENFGVVVAEALAHGVPVITTRGTPWEGLLHHGCGWWVEPTADSLVEALQEAINMDQASLLAMGEKGREYIREFEWTHIAQQTTDVYRWVLGQGPMPECVVRD
jgi:glycosyltransferase involved in cell wall biosynthesis